MVFSLSSVLRMERRRGGSVSGWFLADGSGKAEGSVLSAVPRMWMRSAGGGGCGGGCGGCGR